MQSNAAGCTATRSVPVLTELSCQGQYLTGREAPSPIPSLCSPAAIAMTLFNRRPAVDADTRRQLKTWVAQALALPEDLSISISQLQCHEPGCPPVETVITVLDQPPRTYRIHAAAAAITYEKLRQALPIADD